MSAHGFKLHDVMDIFTKLISSWFFKGIITVCLAILSFGFDPTHDKAFVAIFVLIIVDCFTAIIAVRMSGGAIQSSKFFRTPIKIGIYFGLIYVARVSEYAVPILSNFLDETMIGFIATTELISLMENVHKMGYSVPSHLINKLINIRDAS